MPRILSNTSNQLDQPTALRSRGFLRHGWVHETGRGVIVDQRTTRNTVVAPNSCVQPVAGLHCTPLGTSRLAGTTARGYSGHYDDLFSLVVAAGLRVVSVSSSAASVCREPDRSIADHVNTAHRPCFPTSEGDVATINYRTSPRTITVLRRPKRSSGILQPIAIQVAALK